MRTKAQKWGNSLAIRIPKAIADQVGVQAEDELDIEVDATAIRLTPRSPELKLAHLLAGVTDANLHDEVDHGRPEGSETW